MRNVLILFGLLAMAGCSSYSGVNTVQLKTSNRSIDVVLHRSDVRFSDCGTLTVLQTYSAEGTLIDSKDARGTSLLCAVVPALIEAGGRVGAAAATPAAKTTISNAVNNASNSASVAGAAASSSSSAQGGQGGNGGNGGNGGSSEPTNHSHPHGNNGIGNGGNDGSPNGHEDSDR